MAFYGSLPWMSGALMRLNSFASLMEISAVASWSFLAVFGRVNPFFRVITPIRAPLFLARSALDRPRSWALWTRWSP